MTPRATPLAPEERREELLATTLPLLLEHGRGVTTKQIADAAGVAEGTIFRVFESKDDLITTVLERAMDPGPFIDDLRALPADRPLRETVSDLVRVLQRRFQVMFELMSRLGLTGPPKAHRHTAEARAEAERVMARLLKPHAKQLRVPAAHFVRVTRMLTFAGSHPHLSDGKPLTVAQIVTTVLDGLGSEEVR